MLTNAIPYVTGGLTLLAVAIAASVYVYTRKLAGREKIILGLPEKARLQAAQDFAERHSLDLSRIKQADRVTIVLEQLRLKAQRQWQTFWTLMVGAGFVGSATIFSLFLLPKYPADPDLITGISTQASLATETVVEPNHDSVQCFPPDPKTGSPLRELASRACRPGKLSYVQWHDDSEYPATDLQTGRWPNDRPNRALTLQYIDDNGDTIFSEQGLIRVGENGMEIWQKPGQTLWTELIDHQVLEGQHGSVLRRIKVENHQTCKLGDTFKTLDMFVPLVAPSNVSSADGPSLMFRWIDVECLDLLDLGSEAGPFDRTLGDMTKIGFDPA